MIGHATLTMTTDPNAVVCALRLYHAHRTVLSSGAVVRGARRGALGKVREPATLQSTDHVR